MGRKRKQENRRVVVSARIAEGAAERLRAVAGANGRDFGEVLRDIIERAAKKAA